MLRVATDVGGTFTDLVYCRIDAESGEAGEVVAVKSDTTPPEFERGVMATLRESGVPAAEIGYFAHGATVVVNALTERKGARTGLLTTEGFRDVLEIARGNRPDLFNFTFSKPTPFVPRHLRREMRGRLDHRGAEVHPLELSDLEPIVAHFRAEGVQAVAICFLHAYANPAHEIAAAAALRRLWPELRSVVASHEVTREWREYERSSTTVLAAYVHPLAGRYLARLQDELGGHGVRAPIYVMQSNGGVGTVQATGANPIGMVESGPASGMLGAAALGAMIGERDLIALDIGGTTAKCALIENGEARITTDYKLEWSRTNAGYPIKAPVVDLVEIGAGGGSIAWIDAGGKLHVGPRSAGALPGPVAYGRGGTEPTTTDANLLTGRLNPARFLGGTVVPELARVREAFAGIAGRIGVTVEEAARGVIRIVNASMANALKLVSLNKGYDPRAFTLVAFGGGGGLHAAALARELGIPKVIVPVNAAVFSAWGMLMTDLRRDALRTRLVRIEPAEAGGIAEAFAALQEELAAAFGLDGIAADRLEFQRFADMRYRGQEHSVKVAFPSGAIDATAIAEAIERFHAAHEREYSFRLAVPIELVTHHLAGWSRVSKPGLPRLAAAGRDLAAALAGHREIDLDQDGVHQAAIYLGDKLPPRTPLAGPAVIEESATATLVLPGQSAALDEYGNIHITITSTPAQETTP